MRLRTTLLSILFIFTALSSAPAFAAPTAQSTATSLVNTLNKKLPTYTTLDDATTDVNRFAAIAPSGTITAYTVNTDTERLVGAWNVNMGGKVVCVVYGLNDKFISAKGSCLAWYDKNRSKIMAKSSLSLMDQLMTTAYRAASATVAFNGGTKVTISNIVAEIPNIGGSDLFTVTNTKTSITLKNQYTSGVYRIKGSKISR
jgi:hypothetical protein